MARRSTGCRSRPPEARRDGRRDGSCGRRGSICRRDRQADGCPRHRRRLVRREVRLRKPRVRTSDLVSGIGSEDRGPRADGRLGRRRRLRLHRRRSFGAAGPALNWQGRFLVVGFAAGEIPKIPLNLLLLSGAEMSGVFWGEAVRRDPEGTAPTWQQVLDVGAEGRLKPRIHGTFPLERDRGSPGRSGASRSDR